MARLFGLVGNRTDLGGRVLALEADVLRVRPRSVAPDALSMGLPDGWGWGIGFYQGGEVLLRRRPSDPVGEIDMGKIAGDVRADVVIGHVRAPTVGTLSVENTHPFRYRQWLFAQTGTVPQFEALRARLLGTVPDFLRGGIRGETDAEVVFHVFLSFLHDAGILNDATIAPGDARDALRSTVAVIDGMAEEAGSDAAVVNLLVTNGEFLVALHRSDRMAVRLFHGKEDAEALVGDDPQLRRKTPELGQLRFAMLASDFDEALPPRWRVVPERSTVTLTRDAEAKIASL